jgi:hypothetical protein
MSIDRLLPARGTSLLFGKHSSWQSNIALEVVLGHALAGGCVVWICASEHDSRQLTDNIIAWRGAREIKTGTRLRVFPLVEPDNRSLDGYLRALRAHEFPADVTLIVKDISRTTGHDACWLDTAHQLAEALETSVFTVAADASPYFDPGDVADVITRVTASLGIGARLKPLKPTGKEIILEGAEVNRVILFQEKPSLQAVGA